MHRYALHLGQWSDARWTSMRHRDQALPSTLAAPPTLATTHTTRQKKTQTGDGAVVVSFGFTRAMRQDIDHFFLELDTFFRAGRFFDNQCAWNAVHARAAFELKEDHFSYSTFPARPAPLATPRCHVTHRHRVTKHTTAPHGRHRPGSQGEPQRLNFC